MPLSALLFDLDGTLADSDPLHFKAFQTVIRRWGGDIDETYFTTRMSGRSNAEICRDLFPDLSPADHVRMAHEKETLFRSSLSELQPVAGITTMLDWAGAAGLSLAVVSNAPRDNITAVLDIFAMADRFDCLVSGEELARGKPDPLPYRTALAALDVAPTQAVVFEDAVPGLTAAVRAGIPSVGVLTSQQPETLVQAGAILTIRDFTDPALLPFLNDRLSA